MNDPGVPEEIRDAMKALFPGKSWDRPHRLAGDASSRVYYRTRIEGAGDVILMLAPDQLFAEHFAHMTTLMRELGVDTPDIYCRHGKLVVIEDLSDNLLTLKTRGMNPAELESEYKRQIDDLLRFQEASVDHAKRDMPCFGLAFDMEKLGYEIKFTDEHYISGYLKHFPGPETREIMKREWGRILGQLAEHTEVLAHRDLHSRNIIRKGKRSVWIDYQDARMGRRQYDLASLLLDPYENLPWDTTRQLADYYYSRLSDYANPPWSYDRFIDLYELSGLQRIYKALGTFGYQATVVGVDTYVRFMSPAVDKLRKIMRARSDLRTLESALSPLLDK